MSYREVGSVTLKIAYGYTAESHKNDPLIDMSTDVMAKFGRAAVPGTYLVDTFPFRRYPYIRTMTTG